MSINITPLPQQRPPPRTPEFPLTHLRDIAIFPRDFNSRHQMILVPPGLDEKGKRKEKAEEKAARRKQGWRLVASSSREHA